MRKLYVITGASGSGKSTVLRILKDKGYVVLEEQARKIIAQENKKPDGMSRDDPEFPLFLTQKQQEAEHGLPEKISFIDRGIIDSLAFLAIEDKQPSKKLLSLIKKAPYEKKVFFLSLPPKEVFGKSDHKHSEETYEPYERSLAFVNLLQQAYTSQGYELFIVPFASFEEQANMIEEEVLKHKWVHKK